MSAIKKVERGTLWLAGPKGGIVNVRPADGARFRLPEWQLAVGGYADNAVPAIRGCQVWVNYEGKLKGLPVNVNTWQFANRRVYLELNAFIYPPDWLVSGNALEIYKVDRDSITVPDRAATIAEAMRRTEEAKDEP